LPLYLESRPLHISSFDLKIFVGIRGIWGEKDKNP